MERELQIEATAQWLLGSSDSLEACLQTLQKLETAHGLRDSKAAHNLAIIEYYCSQCKDPAALIDQLDALAKSQNTPSKQQPPPTQPSPLTPSLLPARSLSTSSSAAAASAAAAATAAAAASMDAYLDPCASEGEEVARVCQLNKAILLYKQGSYGEAIELLEPAFAELEVLHDGHALHMCTLLMDCLLACHQPQRAAAVLLALEQAFADAPPPDASPPHHQTPGTADPCAPPLLPVRAGGERGVAAPCAEQPLLHSHGATPAAQMGVREGSSAAVGHKGSPSSTPTQACVVPALTGHSLQQNIQSASSTTSTASDGANPSSQHLKAAVVSAAAVNGSAPSVPVGSSSSSSGGNTRHAPEALDSSLSASTCLSAAAQPQVDCGNRSGNECGLGGALGGLTQAGSGSQQQQQRQSCIVALPPVTRWDSDAMGQARQLLHQQGHVLAAPNARLLIQMYRAELLLYQHQGTNVTAAHEVAQLLALAPGSLAVTMLRAHLLSAQGSPDSAVHVLLDVYQQQQQQLQQQQFLTPCVNPMLHQAHAMFADGVIGSGTCPTLLAPTALCPEVTQAVVLNNVGLLHHQAGRPHFAVTLLERALHQLQHEVQLPGVSAAAGAGGAVSTASSPETNPRAPAAGASCSGVDCSSSRDAGSVGLPSVSTLNTPSPTLQASSGSSGSFTATANTSSANKGSLLSSHPITIASDFASPPPEGLPGPSPSSYHAAAAPAAAPQQQHTQQSSSSRDVSSSNSGTRTVDFKDSRAPLSISRPQQQQQQQQQQDQHGLHADLQQQQQKQQKAAGVNPLLEAQRQHQQREGGAGCQAHVSGGKGSSSAQSGIACSVLYNLGVQHLQLGHWEQARSCFRRAGVGVEEGVWAEWDAQDVDGGPAASGVHASGKGEVVVIDARMVGAEMEGAAGYAGGGTGRSMWQLQRREPLCLLRLAEAAINSYLQQRRGAMQCQGKGRTVGSKHAGPNMEGGRLRGLDSSNPGAPPAAEAAAAGAAAQAGGAAPLQAGRPPRLLEEAARALAAGLESLHVQMRMRVQQVSAAEAAATEAALQMAVQGEELVASHDKGEASTSAAGQQGMMNGGGAALTPNSLTYSSTQGAAAEASEELQLMAEGAPPGWAAARTAQVHQALLTNLAFLHLLRDDHQQALQAAQTLLDLPDDSLSPQSLLIGRCYAAEAQVALGNAAEAEGYLSTAILQMQEQPELLQAVGGSNAAPCPGMTAGAASVAAMLVNLAYVLCTEGCHEQARGFVQRALACNSSFKPAYLLLVWLELAQGRTCEALQLLQKSSRSSISGMPL